MKSLNSRIIITREELQNGDTYLICAEYDDKRMRRIELQKEGKESRLGNIYVGRVANIVENIQAAFIEIEKGVTCFYSLRDLKEPYFIKKQGTKPLCIGDELLVEVTRESVKTKPPTVSTNLNFPGRYLILTTENRQLGISKKLHAEERAGLQELIKPYLTKEYGWIVRTNAKDAKEQEILDELRTLKTQYETLMENARHRTTYSLLRKSEPFYLAFLKGLAMDEVEKITTDIPAVYETLENYLKEYEKKGYEKLCFYEDKMVSVSALYGLKHELDRALKRKVWLPSGGYLVIEPTEALTVIDVNSGKNSKKKSKEELIFSTNKEAAIEIAKQLVLRNISGICVIDFIDMKSKEQQEELMHVLRMEVKKDKIPTTLVDITRLGLVELTRKKVKKSLKEQLQGDEPDEK